MGGERKIVPHYLLSTIVVKDTIVVDSVEEPLDVFPEGRGLVESR